MTRPRILVRDLGDELLVLDTVEDRIHRLNGSAAAIWSMRREGRAPEQIAEALVEAYDVEAEVALDDVRDAVARFEALGLVDAPAGTK